MKEEQITLKLNPNESKPWPNQYDATTYKEWCKKELERMNKHARQKPYYIKKFGEAICICRDIDKI